MVRAKYGQNGTLGSIKTAAEIRANPTKKTQNANRSRLHGPAKNEESPKRDRKPKSKLNKAGARTHATNKTDTATQIR